MKTSEMTDHLTEQGVTVHIGHAAENINGADLVVYSAAVSPENPEIVAAKENGYSSLHVRKRSAHLCMIILPASLFQALTERLLLLPWISLILEHAGTDPTILIGGNLPEFHGNAKIGHSGYFVTEACEYMDSFLSLRPKIEIILNIDSDHLDYFKDIDHIVKSFDNFSHLVPRDGFIVAFDGNPFVSNLMQNVDANVVTFGFTENSSYSAKNINFDDNGYPAFDVMHDGEALCRIQLEIPGRAQYR